MEGYPFELVEARISSPVLIAVPHAGRAYSEDILAAMRNPDQACLRLEDRHVDTLAQDVVRRTGGALLTARAPRALLDLNRAPDDVDWGMVVGGTKERTRHSLVNRRARSGLGLVPRRLPGMGEIWRAPIDRAELDRRIETVHRPYHEALSRRLQALRDDWGAAFLIDLHSMPPLVSRHPEEEPAEFVIGDRFGASCSDAIVARSLRYFAAADRRVAHNRPYSGGYVLDRHAAPGRGIHALQIEVCRSTYLCANLDQPSARLANIGRLLAGLVRDLSGEIARLGEMRGFAQAAE